MLQLMALGVPDVMNFDFMSKPSTGKMLLVRSHSAPLGCSLVVTCCVYPRGRPLCCESSGAAGSCREEGGAGLPHCSWKEDGQLPSGAPIFQGKEVLGNVGKK